MEFAEFLSAAVSEEAEVQSTVPKKLKKLKEENLSQFLVSLSEELSNENKSLKSRGLAGIVLKNSLEDWVNMKILIKNKIKQLLLDTLGSPNPEAGHTAAQVIAKIASIDIPRNDWSNFICTLCSNMSQQDKPILMQASLVSLAYVCEEISHYPLTQNQVNIVLEAVVNVINVSQESGVRLAAVTALYNTLNLARPNFEIEVDRIWIMGVVCEVAKDKDTHIKRKAFECLVSIASTYYDFLECHISTLYVLTTKAFEDKDDLVGIQAIEFWSCICDQEIKRRDNRSSPHFHFIEKMCLVLVELLLKTLMKQDEHNESRICDLSLAGGNCLGLIARKVGDSIVDSVMYFVKLKLQEHKSEWRSHWAGTYALGSILEGPRVEKLSPYVLPLLRFLLDGMGDKNTHKKVKKITSRTLIRIFQFLHSPATGHSIISTENIEQIIPVLLKSIKDPSPDDAKKWDRSSYLAAEGCEAIYYIVQGYEGLESGSSVLSPYLIEIIQTLVETAERRCTIVTGDPETVAGIEQRLFFLAAAAYETLSKVVRCLDVSEFIKPLLTFVLSKLETYQNLSQADKAKQGDLQSLWCGFLHVIIQKLSSLKETKPILLEFVHHANIMRLLLEALSSHELNQSVEPLIYSCFGVVALVIGEKFERYVSSVMHRVKKAIEPCAVMTDEYGNHLKRNILEAHSNILKGLKSSKAEVLIPHNSDILKFIEVVIKDVHRNESVERAAVEVLAVIADVFGTQSWGFVFNSRH